MTPRYLVIADYPNSHYEIGQIIELSLPKDAGGWDMVTLANNEEIMPKYPHLFRLLHWWEYRDEKEMPEYVNSESGTVRKVLWWRLDVYGWVYGWVCGTSLSIQHASKVEPATF